MRKKILLAIAFFLIYLAYEILTRKTFNSKPIDIESRQLKTELKNNKVSNDKLCRWDYGYTNNYHLFYLSCVPSKHDDQNSFYTVEKKYKIKKEKLFIKNTYRMFEREVKILSVENSGGVATPIGMIDIQWQ